MKKVEFTFLMLHSQTDLEKEFAALGDQGYRFNSILMTPLGPKAIFERQTDSDVDTSSELAKKFGL